MRRFNPTLVVLMLFFAAALQAGSVTVLETSDPLALTSFFYSYDVPTSSAPVTAEIILNAGCNIASCVQIPTATIDFTMDLYTGGPVRDGIAYLQLSLSSDGDSSTATRVSGAIGPYSVDYCPKGLGCYLNGYFPFTLGVPFTIDLSGWVWVSPEILHIGGGGGSVWASVQLYELPSPDSGPTGAPVEIYLVPEPSSMVTAGTGLSALMLYAAARLFSSATSASHQTWKTPK